MTRIFVDTNILLYSHDHRDPAKQASAKQALQRLKVAGVVSIISTQVLQEFYNGLTRKLLVPQPAAASEVKLLSELQVVVMTPPLILKAVDLHGIESISFWDALVLAAAQSTDCDELWTEDFQTGRLFGKMKVVNPLI